MYNLETSELQLISENPSLAGLAWADESRLLFSREELREGGVVHTSIYTQNIDSVDGPSLLVSLPLDGYRMGLAYDHDFAIFSCPTEENMERLRDEPENREYQRPIMLCATRVDTNNREREDDYFYFAQEHNGYEITSPYFFMGGMKSTWSYNVFFPCKNSKGRALCEAQIGNLDYGIKVFMEVNEYFSLGVFDHDMTYAYIEGGRVLHLNEKKEGSFDIIGKDFEGEKVMDFWPFGYKQ